MNKKKHKHIEDRLSSDSIRSKEWQGSGTAAKEAKAMVVGSVRAFGAAGAV